MTKIKRPDTGLVIDTPALGSIGEGEMKNAIIATQFNRRSHRADTMPEHLEVLGSFPRRAVKTSPGVALKRGISMAAFAVLGHIMASNSHLHLE